MSFWRPWLGSGTWSRSRLPVAFGLTPVGLGGGAALAGAASVAAAARGGRVGRPWAAPVVAEAGYARGVRECDNENSAESSKKEALRCSQRVVPQTHEPSVKTVRCLCAVAPGPTVRPLASASPQSFSTDAARQANFLRCQSDDIFQVKSCTFFRAPDHGTHTRTRIFARVSRLFVEMDGTNLHTQTLTSHAILVNRIRGLVGCFSK